MAKKSNKNIVVWFGDGENEIKLRKRITERCKYVSESAFMKEAAEEKLDRDEILKSVNVPLKNPISETSKDDSDKVDSEKSIDDFLDGF